MLGNHFQTKLEENRKNPKISKSNEFAIWWLDSNTGQHTI